MNQYGVLLQSHSWRINNLQMELTEDLMLYLVDLRDEMRQGDGVEVVVLESEAGDLII